MNKYFFGVLYDDNKIAYGITANVEEDVSNICDMLELFLNHEMSGKFKIVEGDDD